LPNSTACSRAERLGVRGREEGLNGRSSQWGVRLLAALKQQRVAIITSPASHLSLTSHYRLLHAVISQSLGAAAAALLQAAACCYFLLAIR